jgi:hypothetical protein
MDILAFLDEILAQVWAVFQLVFQVLAELAQFITQVLVATIEAIVQFLVGAFKFLLSLLQTLFNDIIHGHFKDLWDDYINFIAKLRAWLKPALDYYHHLLVLWQAVFNKYMKPILQVITAMRKVLGIFRQLHIKWAAKLDDYLAKIEGVIIGIYLKVVAAINRHASFIYMLTSPTGFLRLVPLLHVVQLAAEDLYRLFTGRTMGFWTGIGDPSGGGTQPVKTTSADWQTFTEENATSTGVAGAWAQQYVNTGTAMAVDLAG